MMGGVGFEAECLSRQMEDAYLPATVRKQAVNTDAAKLDLIEGSGLFTLGIDLRTGGKEADRL